MKVRVTRRTETTELGPGFTVKAVYETEFMVGEYGPFIIQIPKAEWSKERERAEIEKIAKDIKAASEEFEV